MFEQITSWGAVLMVAIASTFILLGRDWRWSLGLLALQYAAAFLLLLPYWPLGMASVKLITGWIAAAALGMTRQSIDSEEPPSRQDRSGSQPFKLMGVLISILISLAAAPRIESLIPGIGLPLAFGSLMLISAGLLQLSITARLLPVVTGLLTLLCGFETLYAAVESSILVSGLLAVVDLGLALAGSYLLINSVKPAQEETL